MNVLIASPLAADLAEPLRALSTVDELLYEPDLLGRPRYPCDHAGEPRTYTPEQQTRWDALLARADVLFGFPGDSADGLARALAVGHHVRFVQGTAAGVGSTVAAARLPVEVLERVAFASAAGVHGAMLAEFVFYGLLALRKDARRLERIRHERSWEHYAMGELDGSTIAILGFGGIGVAIARRARAFGMHVIAATRSGAPSPDADESFPTSAFIDVAARADALVVTLPATEQTRGMLDARTLAALRPNAIVVNVGRGSVIDEAALTAALIDGRIAGAVLDVFAQEPLASQSPLWSLPNVVLSPHTSALSLHENERIVALFVENLGRFARAEPLRNALNLTEFY